MKTNKNRRAKDIEKGLRLAWSSLESHLYYTHSGKTPRNENKAFHKKCVKEYSEIIRILTSLY